MTTATIKFGAGFEAPWVVAENEDPIVIRDTIITVFGLADSYRSEPPYKAIVAASRLARGVFEAYDETPATDHPLEVVEKAEERPKRSRKKGLAAQRAAAAENPEDHTTDVPSLIANAVSEEALNDIYDKHEDDWRDEWTDLVIKRKEELANG